MGKLIVFEGTDGSGKSTQFELLTKRLETEGTAFHRLRFPQYEEAPEPTRADAPVVAELLAAVREVFPKVTPKVGAVGGGTCGG